MSPEWAGWCRRHALAFGLTGDHVPDMLALWVEAFEQHGMTPAELGEATTHLIANDPPAFPNQHAERLLARVRARRDAAVRSSRQAPAPGELPECKLCGSSGRVSVPNPTTLRADTLKWGWLAVLCPCPLGRWFEANQPADRRQMTLHQYERLHGRDWRHLLERRRRADAALARAAGPGVFDAAIERIRRKAEAA